MRTFWLASLLFLTLNFSIAQSGIPEPATCGTTDADSSPDLGALGECFDIDSIFDPENNECITLYLRVNVHFFLDDNCEGSILPLYYQFRTDSSGNLIRRGAFVPISDAQKVAEDWVNRSNEQLSNNYPQWSQENWGIIKDETRYCVPFRYALAGVHVHCNTNARDTRGAFPDSLQNEYGVNTNSEFNVYLVNWAGSPNGQANNECITSEVDSGNVFNHEIGHVLFLSHSLGPDGINDTPPINYDYDVNCNGTVTDFVDEKYKQCWTIFTDEDLHPQGPPSITINGVYIADPCERPQPCTSHPCCDWKYGNNNMMSYSAYAYSVPAFTKGQILKMLQTLNTEKYCQYITQIGGDCPPPMANINIFLNEEVDQDCKYCITFEGSMNEQEYFIEFIDAATNAVIHSTGFLSGTARNYCISKNLRRNIDQYNHGFQAGHTYKVRLTVKNACGEEAMEELEFTLPDIDCEFIPDPGIALTRLSPNPFNNQISFDYEVMNQGSLQILLQHTVLPQTRIEILPVSDVLPIGLQTLSFNTYDFPSGIYALIFRFNDYTQSFTLVK